MLAGAVALCTLVSRHPGNIADKVQQGANAGFFALWNYRQTAGRSVQGYSEPSAEVASIGDLLYGVILPPVSWYILPAYWQ